MKLILFRNISRKMYVFNVALIVFNFLGVLCGLCGYFILESNCKLLLPVSERCPKFIPKNIPVTILCYTLNILVELYQHKNCKLMFSGGYFHDNTLMFESREGIEFIKKGRANKAFISAAGVNESLGVTCVNHYEVETKKAIISSADTKILVADSSKFGKVRSAYFADIDAFDIIITDSSISQEYIEIINKMKIDLIIV